MPQLLHDSISCNWTKLLISLKAIGVLANEARNSAEQNKEVDIFGF